MEESLEDTKKNIQILEDIGGYHVFETENDQPMKFPSRIWNEAAIVSIARQGEKPRAIHLPIQGSCKCSNVHIIYNNDYIYTIINIYTIISISIYIYIFILIWWEDKGLGLVSRGSCAVLYHSSNVTMCIKSGTPEVMFFQHGMVGRLMLKQEYMEFTYIEQSPVSVSFVLPFHSFLIRVPIFEQSMILTKPVDIT